MSTRTARPGSDSGVRRRRNKSERNSLLNRGGERPDLTGGLTRSTKLPSLRPHRSLISRDLPEPERSENLGGGQDPRAAEGSSSSEREPP